MKQKLTKTERLAVGAEALNAIGSAILWAVVALVVVGAILLVSC